MKEKRIQVLMTIFLSMFVLNFCTPVLVKAADTIGMTRAYANSNTTEKLTDSVTNEETATDIITPSWQPDTASTYSIIGPDDRVKVNNSKAYPNSCTGQILITWRDGSQSYGTAFIVGGNKALTAGHCIYDASTGGFARSIRMWPGRSLTATQSLYNPYGYADAASFLAYDSWIDSRDSNYDCGMITFSSSIGNTTGWLGLYSNPGKSFIESEFRMTGYSGTGAQMLIGRGSITNSTTKRLMHNIDTMPGTSGAAIYKKFLNNGWTSVGIHTNGGSVSNSGTRIHPSLINKVRGN